MRRYGLRFGLLGPPVLYDAAPVPYAAAPVPYDTAPVQYDTAPTDTPGPPPTPVAALVPRSIRSPKARALLAALLLDAGRIVPVESLKEVLWSGAPPASAQASLHNHVTRLRRMLDDPARLRTVPPGYQLRIEHGELDVHVFEHHLATARAAYAALDWGRVTDACGAALALWRGIPLSGLPAELGGYAFTQRLKEARLLLLEWRYDAELARAETGAGAGVGAGTGSGAGAVAGTVAMAGTNVGQDTRPRPTPDHLTPDHPTLDHPTPDRLVPELAALAAEHPLREAYHRQLMLALHRSGRRAEALAVHRDLRTRLVEELGVEPGPAVRDAHLEILRGRRTAPEPPPTPTPDPIPVPTHRPAQLPPPPVHFTGRTATLRSLHRTLTTEPPPGAGPLTVISGMAGVGKSAVALHVAHALKERFPDGQLYINLHGATPGMTPLTAGQALAALLRDLGTDPRHIPEPLDAAAALLRTLLAPTRTLLVLDDAAHAAQVRPLLPAGPGCAVIVTSRSLLTALDSAHRFPLAPLSDEESAALLRAVSGRDGLGPGHPLVGLTGRLPLALRVVAARLAARQALTPDVLAGQLAETHDRLHHLEYDDLSVRRSLAVAHDALAASEREADRDAALALRHIGALDLPSYGVPLLARLTGTDARRAEAALDRLVDVALLEETAYGRYTPHDLVRDFARELAKGGAGTDGVVDNDSPRTAALRWYAAIAERALTAIVEPGPDQDDRRRPTTVQPPGHTDQARDVPPFAGPEEAFAWADSELENIVALVEDGTNHTHGVADAQDDAGTHGVAKAHGDAAAQGDAGTHGDADHHAPLVSTLLRLLFPYLHRSGRVAEMDVLGRIALRVARRLGDEAAEAYALGDLAGLHFLTGRQKDALALTDRALRIWRRLDRLSWIRRCLNNRGLLLEGLGRYAESGLALRQSLEYSRRLGDRHGQAVTHSHLGNLYEHTDPRAAIEQHRLSLAIGDEIGAVLVQHSAHCNIGYAHLTLGEPAAARPHFEESLRILGGHGDWHGESQSRLGLVRALRLLGRTESAVRECAELLRRADARADCYTGALARHQHGLLLREQGRPERAADEWRRALAALAGTDEKSVVGELRELLAGER
ncbi:BTAD domain-containing putative transcriptional regulator [Streptomyces bobili]|uniref:AfsR/SARP family transcriptional regulator n=1 Tax=Streptomyces bobili TaxID=67280 RepID=UPI00344A36CC